MTDGTERVAWLDCSSGVSGDMLLGALSAVGALDVDALARALPLDVSVSSTPVRRTGLAATHINVTAADDQPHRRLADVLEVIERAGVPTTVQQRAKAVFERLATAEAAVHGCRPNEVSFHEVGAIDAIVDVVGACLGLDALDLDVLVASPIALGAGHVNGAHGTLPVPVPAVVELLRTSTLRAYGGPVEQELATPTGVAVLSEWVTRTDVMPPMVVTAVGVGAGSRASGERPNVLRLVLGTADRAISVAADEWQLLEANVDDLDPRLWPGVIDQLLDSGAADAWLTPILMKKGRPAHTVHVLAPTSKIDAVLAVLFTESSTIGVRTIDVGKRALERDWIDVAVGGQTIRVKRASWDGRVVNAVPEFEDVARAAKALGQPVKAILAAAAAAAQDRLS